MAIHYTLSDDEGTLYVQATGFDESLAQVEAYNNAVIQVCTAGGYARVLCDERLLEYRLTTIDTYALADFLVRHGPRAVRLAIVCNAQGLADARFWEDVATNRGALVRVFGDPAAARDWLKQWPVAR